MDLSAAAMTTADKSNHVAVGMLHTHHSAMHFRTAMGYVANFPLGTLHWALHIHPKITHSRGPIPKPNYMPHPRTHPTYHPKPHPYLISHFATMHRTDRQTHTDQQKVAGNVR